MPGEVLARGTVLNVLELSFVLYLDFGFVHCIFCGDGALELLQPPLL